MSTKERNTKNVDTYLILNSKQSIENMKTRKNVDKHENLFDMTHVDNII